MSMVDEGDSEDEDDMFLTPKQLTVLRKEAKKRKLPIFTLTPEESQGPFGEETLSDINQILKEHELMQVRGISSDSKNDVREVASLLAFNLEREAESFVDPIAVKGFTATLYSPFEDDNPKKIKLFSSFRPNQWSYRERAIRDISGQIMKDEDGNIIRM